MIAAGPSAPDARFWRALSQPVTYPRWASIPQPSRFAFRHRFRRGSPVGCGFRRGVSQLFVYSNSSGLQNVHPPPTRLGQHRLWTVLTRAERHLGEYGDDGVGAYRPSARALSAWQAFSKQPRLVSSASSDWSPGLPTVLPGLAHVSPGTSAAPHARQHVPKAHHSRIPNVRATALTVVWQPDARACAARRLAYSAP